MASQTITAPDASLRTRMRNKTRDARSRTPSPMYLELQSVKSNLGAMDESLSGSNTPRENVWTAAKSMPTWQQPFKGKSSWDSITNSRQMTHYDEPIQSFGGHLNGFDGHFNQYSNGGGYTGYELSDEEIIRALTGPWPLEGQFLSADLSMSRQINPDVQSDPAAFIPPPPGLGNDLEMPSIGTRGHPQNCNDGCKYVWKKRGCRDGAACVRCHLCRPGKPQNSNKKPLIERPQVEANLEPTKPVSIGSIGHPNSCAPACKYNGKKSGCKDGHLCERCHICIWSRCADRAKTDANAGAEIIDQPKVTMTLGGTREMATQTTVDQSTQCNLY